jgi:cephalosporin hydroxylase
LASVGSYCVVWDTGVEDLPEGFCLDRPWGRGNNPKTAVRAYLKRLRDEKQNGVEELISFEIDKFIENKLMITASPGGFLKRVR